MLWFPKMSAVKIIPHIPNMIYGDAFLDQICFTANKKIKALRGQTAQIFCARVEGNGQNKVARKANGLC